MSKDIPMEEALIELLAVDHDLMKPRRSES
jgi:hypothetical protein